MKTNIFRTSGTRRNAQSGQVMAFLLLGLGLFLLGAMAFAFDLGNMWFTRQSAQTAADAACTAGAMDLLVNSVNGAMPPLAGWTPSSTLNLDCKTTPTAAPCQYAALNGYSSSIAAASTAQGINVSLIAAATPAGVTAPPVGTAANPFFQVQVKNNVRTFFAGFLTGSTTQTVRAFATCGVTLAVSPIPIIVLDPHNPNAPSNPSALDVQGNPAITIVGGPSKSIQVNSDDAAAVNVGGTGLIDLHLGGPAAVAGNPGTGSDLGTYGGPTAVPAIPKNFNPGTTGHWTAPASPIADPFAQVCAPGQTGCPNINGNSPPVKPGPSAPQVPTDEKDPANGGKFSVAPCTSIPCDVGYMDHGCPETTATRGSGKCLLYTPGLYDSTTGFASGINVGPGGGSTGVLALFEPGLYYIAGGLALKSNSTARPGTGVGDGSGGIVFYFSGTGTITVASDSGSKVKDAFNTVTGPHDSAGNPYPNDASHTNATTYANGVKCTAGSSLPNNLKNGGAGIEIGIDPSGNPTGANIIMGPCTGYYGDPLGATDPLGVQRGFVFFQDRAAQSVNPNWGGGGQFLLAGTMYFHSCNATGTGIGCGNTPTYYNDIYTMQGNSGSNTYVLGQIVTDNLALGGSSGITMDLNPNAAFNILKASLYE